MADTHLRLLDGGLLDLRRPRPEQIEPETLATVLARKCRFGGHSRAFYSVAQHSVSVLRLLEQRGPITFELALAGLLHDAHEAFSGFGDVCRPAKRLSPQVAAYLDRHERRIDSAIGRRFRVRARLFRSELVRWADDTLLATEARDLIGEIPDELPPALPERIEPLGSEEARVLFLTQLMRLMEGR